LTRGANHYLLATLKTFKPILLPLCKQKEEEKKEISFEWICREHKIERKVRSFGLSCILPLEVLCDCNSKFEHLEVAAKEITKPNCLPN
jgi:hypothetical protein